MHEHLSQDEIDTLLGGVDSGDVDTEVDNLIDPHEAVPYDFSGQDTVVRGRVPALDMINDRFTRSLQTSIFQMLRRTAHVIIEDVKMVKYGEYLKGLVMPTSCNMINVKPLQGTGMIVIDPKLVFATVDNYFGGKGSFHTRIEGREFTPTEKRVVQLLLNLSFDDLKKAWDPVMKLDFNFINSELNPAFAKIVNPTDVVIVSTFKLELDGGGGEFHIVLPHSMIEPVIELLESGSTGEDDDMHKKWIHALKEEMKQATVKLDCSIAHTQLSLSDVLNLNQGDIIPIELSDLVTVCAENTPVFKGALGVSNGKNALRYIEPIKRTLY